MTSNKQVSPAIRILRGERDASARATHLEAATRKFLVTTNERKQMSTKTNFKRIALVAVVALGMGALSSVPAKATILQTVTVTNVAGIATKANSDSVTSGASITINYLTNTTDSVVVSSVISSIPATAATPRLLLSFGDTVGSTVAVASPFSAGTSGVMNYGESVTSTAAGAGVTMVAPSGGGRVQMKLLAHLDTSAARTVGDYVFTIVATPSSGGVNGTPITANLTISVAALASESKVASAGTSTAYLSSSNPSTSDSAPSVLATSSTTPRAYITVDLKNASGAQAVESITMTTTVGTIGSTSVGGSVGKNVTLAYVSGGANTYGIFSDGTAGTAVVTVKSATVTFSNKSVVFYAAAPTSIALTLINAQPGVGTTEVIRAAAKDANGNVWGGTLNIYSDTVATISDTATACSASTVASKGYHTCSVTGVIPGTAKVKVMDASQAVASAEQSLTITNEAPATIKLSWDKASYIPGERGILFVDVLSSTGKSIPAANHQSAFATGGITLNVASGNGSDTVTGTSILTRSPIANSVGTGSDIRGFYVVYMPVSGGTVTATAKGGTLLPAAGQVTVTASATITDSGAAALAAVNALATTVASLKTLITTLTNLVLKIQKKVKA